MEQYRADAAATRQSVSAGRSAGAGRHTGRVGAMAVALGIGAFVAAGTGTALADDSVNNHSGGAVHSPAAGTPAGTSTTANVTATTGAAGRVTHGTPSVPRPPRMQQNNSGGTPGGTRNAGARDDDTLDDDTRSGDAAATRPDIRDSGEGDDRPSAVADHLARFRERLASSRRTTVLDSPNGHGGPATDNPRTSRVEHTVADSGTRRWTRSESVAAVITTRVDARDAADVQHRPSGALMDKPIPGAREALARTDYAPHPSTTKLASAALSPAITSAPAASPVTVVSRLLTAVGVVTPYGVRTGDAPTAPDVVALGLLQAIRREIEGDVLSSPPGVAPGAVAARSVVVSPASATSAPNALAAAAVAPQPGDTTTTEYGDIGKWMLKSNGDIANWGGQTYEGKGLLEPVNVIIVDPTSTSREESIQRLNAAMRASGFPARQPHSTGYYGIIDHVTYGQQPSGFLQAYVDNEGLADHGRMFGPAPAANGQGFVWTGAFSTQQATHGYASFDSAGEELAQQLVNSGAATRLDNVYLGNAENSATQTTGDHTGYAVVLQLNASVPNQPPTATVTQNKPNSATGSVTGKVTALDPERGKLTYTGMTTDKGAVKVTSTGSFTYTPTPTARHTAAAVNATDAQKMDTFDITVSDDFGNTTAVPVTVTVLGKNAVPSARATVGKADPVEGSVLGSITVTDADNDNVTYTHSTPGSGSVTINSDGTFIYNPSDVARQQARVRKAVGTDTFTVTVDDGHGGVKTITVRTSIAPTDRAPVTGALNVGAPATSNGAVKGSLGASDPDGDTFTFSGSTRTSKGYVTVSRGGTFTYTPTAAARRAASSGADTTDTFTIKVTDKYGATTTQSVTVPILGA